MDHSGVAPAVAFGSNEDGLVREPTCHVSEIAAGLCGTAYSLAVFVVARRSTANE